MNKRALALLNDLTNAGVPAFTQPRKAIAYVRTGIVAKTDETEKMEIAGMRCGVTYEDAKTVRLYVFTDGADGTHGKRGPIYTLRPRDVLKDGA